MFVKGLETLGTSTTLIACKSFEFVNFLTIVGCCQIDVPCYEFYWLQTKCHKLLWTFKGNPINWYDFY